MTRPRRVPTPDRSPAHLWGAELRKRRDQDPRQLSVQALAGLVHFNPGHLGRIERGDRFATEVIAEACDLALGAGGALLSLWHAAEQERRRAPAEPAAAPGAPEGGARALSDRERALVRVMSLHALTASYGTAGLWARFDAEAERLPDPADRDKVTRALELAARLHADDRRQREPYLNHLLRVALRIMIHYKVRDADVICAALLHDAVEDHPDGLAADGGREAALAALDASFGPQVASIVGAVTNPEWLPGRDRYEQYRDHLKDSLGRQPWARVVKASDLTDNGAGVMYTTGPKAVRLAGKYLPFFPVLSGLVVLPDTPLEATAKALILSQFVKAQERCAAIAAPPPGARPGQ